MGVFEHILFAVFTLLASAGLYLVGTHFHSRRLGVALGLGSLVFFVALYLALGWMIATYDG
jgi:hypothetical protein